MSAVVALPWVPALVDGENLLGWFRRASTGVGIGPSYLFRAAGLNSSAQKKVIPSGLGLDLSEGQQRDLARFARSTPERMLSATLRRFEPLLDFSSLVPEDLSSVRRFSITNPVEAIGFRACASCIRQNLASSSSTASSLASSPSPSSPSSPSSPTTIKSMATLLRSLGPILV